MSKQTDLRITSKRLGLTTLASYCPRCFWYRLHLKFHPPFDMFGGAIFKQAEQAEMAVFGNLLESKDGLPREFEPFRDLVGRVEYPRDWRKFQYQLDSGAVLYGEPDEICEASDGCLCVLDHKTARPKDGTDPLIGMYETQVNGYALIAERGLKLGTVSKGGLIYWSADHEKVIECPENAYRVNRLWISFVPTPVPIEIDYSTLDAPLQEATRLWELRTPPDRTEKCPDCKKLDALLALDAEAQKLLSAEDQVILRSSGNSAWVRNRIINRNYWEDEARHSALCAIRNEAAYISFSEDGVISNWDGFDDDPDGF